MEWTWAPSTLLVDQPGKIGPDDDEANAGETVVDGLLQLIARAKRDVLIVSPYFVPGREMMEEFRQLRTRGVPVRILTNSLASNDAIAAHAGYARYRKALIDMGVELHEMRAEQDGERGEMGSANKSEASLGSRGSGSKSGSKASLHSKAVIVDQHISVIGSMNLDLRSQRKNSEVALVIRSAAFAQDCTRRIAGTIATGAYLVQLEDGRMVWKAPPGADFGNDTSEPLASTKLKALAKLIAPFAPDEML
jgi:phosphatidylserine/phosphatidylglycerophosphate/cardiolipin synthase-like enzyme